MAPGFGLYSRMLAQELGVHASTVDDVNPAIPIIHKEYTIPLFP